MPSAAAQTELGEKFTAREGLTFSPLKFEHPHETMALGAPLTPSKLTPSLPS